MYKRLSFIFLFEFLNLLMIKSKPKILRNIITKGKSMINKFNQNMVLENI